MQKSRICCNPNINGGLRFGPTVQQGGTGTIQQSIYLTHNNPCGVNLLIYEKIGATEITYFQLKEFLDAMLRTEEVQNKFEALRYAGTDFLFDPTEQNQLKYLYQAMEWGKSLFQNRPDQDYEGYQWRVSVFDYNGVMIWDSFSPELEIVKKSGDIYQFEILDLVTQFYSNTPPFPVRVVDNPFLPPGKTTIQLYGICNNPAYSSFLDPNVEISEITVRSSFLVNQVALPESIMSISSLLTDPANTRVFGVTKYGFSSRQNTFNSAYIGYHCVYLNDIKTIGDNNPTLIETMFVRLSLEQLPDVKPRPNKK